jgi:hypothetical protein
MFNFQVPVREFGSLRFMIQLFRPHLLTSYYFILVFVNVPLRFSIQTLRSHLLTRLLFVFGVRGFGRSTLHDPAFQASFTHQLLFYSGVRECSPTLQYPNAQVAFAGTTKHPVSKVDSSSACKACRYQFQFPKSAAYRIPGLLRNRDR